MTYLIQIVKRFRWPVLLLLCFSIALISKLYYSATEDPYRLIINTRVSEIFTVDDSDIEKTIFKNTSDNSVLKNQTVKSISVSEKLTVTRKLSINSNNNDIVTVTSNAHNSPAAKAKVFQNVKVNKKSVIKSQDEVKNDISCHYSTENDVLSSVEDPSFSPGDKPIFFHETSCRGGINYRQACAIESAARLHPKRQVNVLFSAPITHQVLNNSNLMELLELDNVKILRLHIEQYSNGTVVDPIFRNQIKKSSYPIEHVSDILRIITLYKFGGVYLDTDSLLVRSLDSLPPNWIAKEREDSVSSGAIGFSIDGVGHNLAAAILKELHDTYQPDSWSNNGPIAIQRVLERICKKVVIENGDCKGLEIYPPKLFYPIHYRDHTKYFKKGIIDTEDQPYMHHMWNHFTRNIAIEKDSPYAKLAEQFCPTIFGTYGSAFGQ